MCVHIVYVCVYTDTCLCNSTFEDIFLVLTTLVASTATSHRINCSHNIHYPPGYYTFVHLTYQMWRLLTMMCNCLRTITCLTISHLLCKSKIYNRKKDKKSHIIHDRNIFSSDISPTLIIQRNHIINFVLSIH